MKIKIPKLARDLQRDNYLSGGFHNCTIGTSSGVTGTGSLAVNDYILNGLSNIATGTSVSQRLGNKLYFTTMLIDLAATMTANGRIRVIVGKTKDPKAALQSTNTLLTAYIEGTQVLEPPLVGVSGTIPIIDYPVSAATDISVISDRTFLNMGGSSSGITMMKYEVPLKQMRGYDNSSNVIDGSWFLYIVGSDAGTVTVTGIVKVNFVNYST